MLRILAHYFSAFVLLTIYGGQVCPFVDSLPFAKWLISTAVVFSISVIIHLFLDRDISQGEDISNKDIRTFKITMAIFIANGIILGSFNGITYDFPIQSALKLKIGWIMVGYFTALDLSLKRRRDVFNYLQTSGLSINIKSSYASLTKKFAMFSTISIVLILSVSLLVIIKDLDWLMNSEISRREAAISILKEFIFIFSAVLAYVGLAIYSFTSNLKLYLCHQNSALSEVSRGNLETSVPVGSSDEFGTMAKYTNEMINSLKERTENLQTTQDVAILSLTSLAETRDNETGGHIMRTQEYVLALANNLKDNPKFSETLTEENIQLIYKSAPLHDIGKVGIPDSILLKPGKLTDEEFKIMKRHPYYGKQALAKSAGLLGSNSFLKFAEEIAFTHHEKWDGSGYPKMLKGEDIPVSGRLMALADVYDALISKRVYKDAMSHQQAKEIITDGSGKHFDPDIVKAFVECEQTFIEIAERLKD